MNYTDTKITVRSFLSKEVYFRTNFLSANTPTEQIKQVLRDWSSVTGLNWSAMPMTQMESYSDWVEFEVVSPLDNQSKKTFIWQV